jgi:hypothetical protein
MLIKVRDGIYNPTGTLDRDDTLEPKGRELWSHVVEGVTVTALLDAKVAIEPGSWYSLDQFKLLIEAADPSTDGGIYSTVSTIQPGVGRAWVATMEVRELNAALMVCRSVINHVERLSIQGSEIWVRVE